MNTLIIDFETYYDKDVTLKKMNYSEYVPKAEPYLLAATSNSQGIFIYEGPNYIRELLSDIDWANTTLVGHNLQFDALVLKHWFGHQAAYHIDTLCMARYLYPTMKHDLESLREHLAPQIPPKLHSSLADVKGLHYEDMDAARLNVLANYCGNDVRITETLYYTMKPRIEQRELDLIDWTIKLFLNPVLRLDTELAIQAIQEEQTLTTELLNLHGLTAETVRSNAKFFNHLVAQGYNPPTKWSAKTGKIVPAFAKTDTDFADFCIENGIEDLYEVKQRLNSNIKETKTARLISAANENDGRVPVAYNYHGAFTGRFSGGNKYNLQSLPRGGTLRYALQAPPGHTLLMCDLAQIEARVVAWVAGEKQMLNAFREKKDLYSEVASQIFGRPINKNDHPDERFCGKAASLGLNYGMGSAKFKQFCKNMGRDLEEDFCQQVVTAYRERYSRIVALWNFMGEGIKIMANVPLKAPSSFFTSDVPLATLPPATDKIRFTHSRMHLPSGRILKYNGLTPLEGNMWRLENKRKVYSALLVENCVAAGTLVLTEKGWQPIENIEENVKIHDGVEFVKYGAVVFKSVQACVTIDGVHMTPDHEVLTNEGWLPALEKPRPYRPKIREINGLTPTPQRWKRYALAIPMRLWRFVREARGKSDKSCKAETTTTLRLHPYSGKIEHYARTIEAPSLCCMAFDERPLSTTFAPRLEELWWTWNNGMRTLAKGLHEFLERYERHLPTWINPRKGGQREGLQPRKLQMGYTSRTRSQHTPFAEIGCSPTSERTQHLQVDLVLPPATQRPYRPTPDTPVSNKPVYDIVNCGPRQRFVVKGVEGPFIVHNCVQAISADILCDAILNIKDLYTIVMTTHDEIVICVPDADVETAQANLLRIMCTPPSWGLDIPLAASTGCGKNYGECK